MGEACRRYSIQILATALLVALAVHFSITLMHLTPLNPVKLRLLPYIDRYIQPFFQQRWQLFAPDPLPDTRMLLVACRTTDEHGNIEEHPWSNMSAPLMALKRRYRLTPADRIDRAQQASVHLLFQAQEALPKKILEHPNQEAPQYKAAIKLLEQQRQARQELGMRLLARTASAECDRLYGPGRAMEVRTRMVTIKPPPFSQRYQPEAAGKTTYLDLPWAPYERVAPL